MADKVTLDGELMFPKDYLNAVEFKGKDVTLTVTDARWEDMRVRGAKESKRKPVLAFKETKKKFVCNTTNADSIKHLLGKSEAKDWIGHRITLYPTRVPFGRETKDAIRVREKINDDAPPLAPDAPPTTNTTTTDCKPGEMDDVISEMDAAGIK
ncbi:hypothetical protein LCGC14_0568750 [marine sediment metagenome]|uniref:Uncharacterized protein n=1 Tax=marine sediment metagenome TaxID=412755 RepID=A0A0F9RQ13_9ZZZZ|nr:hypothetical protein [Phycisphaerae bacterium]